MKKKFFKYTFTKNFNNSVLLLLLFVSFSFFFSPIILCAQETPKVNVLLKLRIIDGDLKNSQITITKTGMPYKVIDPSKGGDAVDLPLGFEYAFTFTKMGYNTKRLVVDTHVPEYREREEFAKQISEVELDKLSGKLEDNYVQMIGKITYSMNIGDFDFDKNYLSKTDKTNKDEKTISPIIKSSVDKSEPTSSKTIGKKKEVKIIQEDYRKFTIITLTIDGKELIYKKEEYGWATFYYKEGKRIEENTFINETL